MRKIEIDSIEDYSKIPPNENCKGCGGCCGIVPIDERDRENIERYLKDNPKVLSKARKQHNNPLMCMFLDKFTKRCMIYEVRPITCRLFGVIPFLQCPNGNSDCIKPEFQLQGKHELINYIFGRR